MRIFSFIAASTEPVTVETRGPSVMLWSNQTPSAPTLHEEQTWLLPALVDTLLRQLTGGIIKAKYPIRKLEMGNPGMRGPDATIRDTDASSNLHI